MGDTETTQSQANEEAVTDSQDTSTSTASVTEAELNAALEGEVETQTKEASSTTETQGDDTDASLDGTTNQTDQDDHTDKSRLGRKVKNLSDQMSALMTKMDEYISKPSTESSTTDSTDTIETPEYIATPEDVEKYLQAREQRITQAQKKYQSDYVTELNGLKQGNEDIHDQVVAEMMENFNIKRPNNPGMVDAQLNYTQAMRKVLTSNKTANVPVKGDNPSGVTHGNTNTTVKTEMPKLSADAAEFVRLTGMKAESVRDALGENKHIATPVRGK